MCASLPSANEINVYDSLDELAAVEHFLGKDLDQARELFQDNFLYYQEDLLFMGPRAFCFYVPAAIGYLCSAEADDDSDAASSFCSVIEIRLDRDIARIASAIPSLRTGIQRILADFRRYRCDAEIYGDVERRYRALLRKLVV